MKRRVSRSSNILSRGFVAILLLVIFLTLAIVLPKLLTIPSNRKFVINIGYLDVSYNWINNETLLLIIVNKYSVGIELDRLICNNYEFLLNNTFVEPGHRINITINSIYINRTCFAKLTYYLENKQYSRIVFIEPCGNYDFLKRSSNSTRPRG